MSRRQSPMFRRAVLAAALAALPPAPALAQSAGSPFVDDAKAGATVRSMYFLRDLPNAVHQETWALAGSLWGRTGYWRDFLAFGGRVYVDVPLYGPNDRDGGRLLKPGQDGFGVIAEANAKLKYADQVLT